MCQMPGVDKPTGRVVGLILLLILVAAALRGYLPVADGGSHSEPGSGRAALTFVIVALSASVALMAFAMIARLRDPRVEAPSAGTCPRCSAAARDGRVGGCCSSGWA
ncbi:hypothetical protein I547_0782 [Mycobacterium kansasii 824]|nr:hypothetical protein I547_0782 [Mycobacterium kansasii 824]